MFISKLLSLRPRQKIMICHGKVDNSTFKTTALYWCWGWRSQKWKSQNFKCKLLNCSALGNILFGSDHKRWETNEQLWHLWHFEPFSDLQNFWSVVHKLALFPYPRVSTQVQAGSSHFQLVLEFYLQWSCESFSTYWRKSPCTTHLICR